MSALSARKLSMELTSFNSFSAFACASDGEYPSLAKIPFSILLLLSPWFLTTVFSGTDSRTGLPSSSNITFPFASFFGRPSMLMLGMRGLNSPLIGILVVIFTFQYDVPPRGASAGDVVPTVACPVPKLLISGPTGNELNKGESMES